MARATYALVCLLGLSLPVCHAAAIPPRIELRWADESSREAMECIAAPALMARVERVLERPVGDESGEAPVVLLLDVARTPAGFVATLTLRTRDGETIGVREIEQEGARCAVLDGPLVVVTAMLADLRELESRLDLRDERSDGRRDERSVRRPVPPPPATESPRVDRDAEVRAGVWVAAEAAWMLLPELAGAGTVGVWIRPPGAWPIELTASVYPDSGTGADAGATFLAFAGSVSLCGPIDEVSWHLRICGGAGAGLVRGVGHGFGASFEEVRPYVDVRAAAELDIVVAEPLVVLLRFGAAVPLLRTYFVGRVGDEEVALHSYGYVVPFGDVGLGVHF